jgi:exodeoxyribonuclease V gamma subunit
VARDAVVTMAPLDPARGAARAGELVALWRRNLDAPLPVACKTALALLAGGDPREPTTAASRSGEVDDLCLARLWPEFACCARPATGRAVARRCMAAGHWLATAIRCAAWKEARHEPAARRR